MKNKAQIKKLLNEALDLLKKQVLMSDELKARSMISMAIGFVDEADDEDGEKSQAV